MSEAKRNMSAEIPESMVIGMDMFIGLQRFMPANERICEPTYSDLIRTAIKELLHKHRIPIANHD